MSIDAVDAPFGPCDYIERAADEGVPLGALKRIFRVDDANLREFLHTALASGRLVALPKEDWPPLVPRDQRVPTVPRHDLGEDDQDVIMKMARHFHTTKLEGNILLVILRRRYATREALHDAVESNRGNPDEATDKKIVDVVVCKLRKKLAPLGLTLHTIHSIGYEISEADRQKAWAIVRGQSHVSVAG